MSSLPPQVNYHVHSRDAARYKTLSVPLTNNPSGSYIASGNSLKLQFQMPSSVVYNLKRSSISYTIKMAASGGNYNVLARDQFQIANSLELVTANGVSLVKINNCAKYTKIADKYYAKQTDFLSRSALDLEYPTNDIIANNSVPSYTPGVNPYGIPDVAQTGGLVANREPKYFLVGSAVNTPMVAPHSIKLGDIGHSTLFEQDKDVYFGETVYLNIMTAPVESFAYVGAGGAVNGYAAFGANVAAGALTVTNITLNLAVEDNLVLANSVMAKYDTVEGIQIRTDYVDTITTPINSTSANININIPQMAHTHLKRIINSVFNSNETGADSQDCSNFNGSKITRYQTVLDSQPLQNNIIDCTYSDADHVGNTDYTENESFIEGSAVAGLGVYMFNWAHIDDFFGDDSLQQVKELANYDGGLPLDVSRSYTLRLTTPNTVANANNNNTAKPLTLYTWIVTSRIIRLGVGGASWVL